MLQGTSDVIENSQELTAVVSLESVRKKPHLLSVTM